MDMHSFKIIVDPVTFPSVNHRPCGYDSGGDGLGDVMKGSE